MCLKLVKYMKFVYSMSLSLYLIYTLLARLYNSSFLLKRTEYFLEEENAEIYYLAQCMVHGNHSVNICRRKEGRKEARNQARKKKWKGVKYIFLLPFKIDVLRL